MSSPLTTCCYPDNVLLTAGNDIVARVYALPTPARGRGRGRSAVSAWVEREILLLGVASKDDCQGRGSPRGCGACVLRTSPPPRFRGQTGGGSQWAPWSGLAAADPPPRSPPPASICDLGGWGEVDGRPMERGGGGRGVLFAGRRVHRRLTDGCVAGFSKSVRVGQPRLMAAPTAGRLFIIPGYYCDGCQPPRRLPFDSGSNLPNLN